MDEPLVEFLKVKSNTKSNVPNIIDNTQTSPTSNGLTQAKSSPNREHDKSSSELSNNETADKKSSSSSLARKQRKKLRRRRKSDLRRQHSFDKGDDQLEYDIQVMSTSDEELTNRELKEERGFMGKKFQEFQHEQIHVSLSDLVQLSDGSPTMENKFKLKSVTTEPDKVCVPTMRKIFTPVVDDCNGKPHVVGYVLRSAVNKRDQLNGTDGNNDLVHSKHLDLDNSLEYIDKSDETDGDKISNSSLQAKPINEHIRVISEVENKETENLQGSLVHRKVNNNEILKQNEIDKSERSKIKSIIEKYNKLTYVTSEETVLPPNPKVNKVPSNKIRELTEVFDTDGSSKHSSQGITAPLRDENNHDPLGKVNTELSKSPLSKSSSPQNTSDELALKSVVQSTHPSISEDYRTYRRNKTKLQIAKEEFLSSMAFSRKVLDNNTVVSADTDHADVSNQHPRLKQVQKSFSSGMINTLSSKNYDYGKLDKEAAISNESHVKPKKLTKSFREKFNTFRLRFRKPKSDKNHLGVGTSLDTGINTPHSDISARTSTYSIASSCSKSSGWRKIFDR